MKLTELFLGELDREAPLTRRVLERVPEGRNEWKPHEKSMPLGRLAALVAGMPSWLAMMIDKTEFDLNPPGGSSGSFQTNFRTTGDLLKSLDEGVVGRTDGAAENQRRPSHEAVAPADVRQDRVGASAARHDARLDQSSRPSPRPDDGVPAAE